MMYAHLSILLPPALSSHILYQAGQSVVGPRGNDQGRGGLKELLLTDHAWKYITIQRNKTYPQLRYFKPGILSNKSCIGSKLKAEFKF